ncbi:methyl-accepting chemotaxis protein [Oceanisphaera sp. W20_SRM_FM3]|uniref:methyl-accepting chemotaxis protein n=1 Tax=Oceanisphaera sp. W20_SRM_FM3 TaxID=3240267 RepID=UPI003F975307
MKIKHKLGLNTLLVILAIGALFVLFAKTLSTIKTLNHGTELAMSLETGMLSLRREEKDFLGRQNMKYVADFQQTLAQNQQLLDELEQLLAGFDFDTQALDTLRQRFDQYGQNFEQVVQAHQLMGLDHESGLNGELRAAVHGIEQALAQHDADAILVTMLQLRRAEKDFILRQDPRYLDKFDTFFTTLQQQLRDAAMPTHTLSLASTYQDRFHRYAEGARRLGLDSDQGLQLTMRKTIQSTEDLLDNTVREIEALTHRHADRASTLAMVMFVTMLLLTSVIALLIARSIFIPISRIQQGVQQIHESHDLSLRVEEQGNDELTDMARALNTMLAGFQRVIRQVNEAVETMNQTTEILSENAARTSADIERQQAETEMVATAVTEMVSTIEEIAHNTENTALKANSTHNGAQQGQLQVQGAIGRIRRLSDTLDNAVGSMEALSTQSDTIGNVLGVIHGIAEQTNLLALNAAIEAARAGEQGRGFAVVADEVRALAGRTQEATQEISAIIKSLQTNTSNMVKMIHSSSEEGRESSQQAGMVETVLNDITREVTEISDMATQIATAIEQQSSVASEVGQNVVVIRDITEDAAQAVRNNSRASSDIAAQARELRQVVAAFRV